jgi:UPF0716 protein FxsA
MFGLLALLFIVAPIVELYVIVQVGQSIGVLETVVLLIGISVVGAWLAKLAGLGVLRRLQATVRAGKVPSGEVVDGGLVLLASALMIAPGFISDALAILLLLPPSRAVVRRAVLRRIRDRGGFVQIVTNQGGGRAPADDVWDVESWEDPPPRPELGPG